MVMHAYLYYFPLSLSPPTVMFFAFPCLTSPQQDTAQFTYTCQQILLACSGADFIWHGRYVPPLLQQLGMERGTVSRRTAKNKMTKLYLPSRKLSLKRLIVFVEPKKLRVTTQFFYGSAPLSMFSGATVAVNA